MRPHIVQRHAVLMHFDESYAARVSTAARVPGLDARELALLQAIDPRAFRTDPERPLRLLAALLEEYPVSCALIGAAALPAFLTSSPFRNAILKDRLVADAFGDWLFARAGAVAQIELAVVWARRRRARRGVGIARAPGVELARVPEGTLAFYARGRDELGERPHEKVAHGARLTAPSETDALEHLLVVDAAGGPAISGCAEGLFALLAWAREGAPRDDVVEEARRLGADDEAPGLVEELLAEGLLAVVGAPNDV